MPEQHARHVVHAWTAQSRPHAEIADDGRWLDDTAVNPNGRVRWKPPEVRRRAEPKKHSLVAV